MTELSERTIRKFNPGTFQSDAEVISQFVVRERELAIVLEVLNDNLDAPSCQHTLLVAPRGRGKTMLLARVAAELRARSALAERLLPVRFMEESQEILDSGDFWLEALFHLAAEISKSDSAMAQELRAAHEDLAARWRGDDLDLRARSTVLDTADRLGRQLVLMVENLQDLCGDVDDDFGWKLRAVLQTEPQIMLLATATSRFEALDDPEQPFFELFRTLRLEPLDTGECRRLWQVVSGDDVIERQIRPLQILTGGNPRLLVIVAEFARHRSLRQLMEELVTLIDDHTEYFRSHLQGIAKTERRVYLAVIDLWQPSSTAEITARSRLDVRTVSAMLGRLANRGAISVEGSGRKRWYAAAERLYSIYYKLRRQRDEAAVIQNLIRFMTAFYSGAELEDTIDKVSIEATQEPSIREGIERAGAEDPRIAELFSSFSQPSIDEESKSAHMITVRTLFDRALIHSNRRENTAALELYDELVERYGDSDVHEIQEQVAKALFNKGATLEQQGAREAAIKVYEELAIRYGDSKESVVHVQIAKAMVNKGAELSRQQGKHEDGIRIYDELVERYGASDIPEVQEVVAKGTFNKGVELWRQGNHEAAMRVYDELVERYRVSDRPEVQEVVANALFNKGVELWRQGNHEAAMRVYDELVERYRVSDRPEVQEVVANALFNKGVGLSRQGGREAGINVYDELVDRYGVSDRPEVQEVVAKAMVNKGSELSWLGDHKAETRVYDELVDRYGASDIPKVQKSVAMAMMNKGLALWRQGAHEAGIKVYDELFDRYGESEESVVCEQIAKALFNKGVELSRQGADRDAIDVYDELVDRYGESELCDIQEPVAVALFNKARVLTKQGDFRAAIISFHAGYTGSSVVGEMIMLHIQEVVIGLATEAQQRDVLDILLMDNDKCTKLRPLVVALRKELGEQVRAPAEVMEVAEDIIKEIERRRASKVAMAVSADPKEGHGAPADQGTTPRQINPGRDDKRSVAAPGGSGHVAK